MDTRQDSPRQPTAAQAALLVNLPNSPTTPLLPTPSFPQPQPPLLEASLPFHVDIPPGQHLQDNPTPLLTFSRTWEPTPENISGLLQCEGICLGNEDGHLGDNKDNDDDDSQHASSPSSSSADSSSLSPSSAASPLQGEGQSLLQAGSTAAVAVASDTDSGRPLSTSQLSASAKPTTAARKNKGSSSAIKLVQQIPPQSRTYFKSVPSLQRQSYASSGSNGFLRSNSSGSGLPSPETTVDPFGSDRDILSKVYILTTSAHGTCLAALSAKKQRQQNQLPPKYLLKVFPNRMPFKHRATRTDPESKPESAKAVMNKIVEDAIQHELGAIKWAHKYLRETNTPKILGYSSPGGRSTELSEGVEKYGVLGFILTEFPAAGIIYQGPLEEFKTKESQQIEMSERLAKILYEMRSLSHSMRVSGFSIHLTSKADDGSPTAVDKVSTPYSRFDMIVHELHRKDAEEAVKLISRLLLDTAAQATPSTSSSSTEAGAQESSQVEIVSNFITNEPLEDSGGTITTSSTVIDDIHSSDLTTILENSSSSNSSSPSAAPVLIYPPPLTPAKDPRRMSLQMRMHRKNIERKMSASNEMQEFPPMPMPQPTTPSASSSCPAAEAADIITLATIADTIEAEGQTNVDFPPDAEEPASRRQHDLRREENPQDNLIQTIAKRLVNASPPPRDALEACRRISQSGNQHQAQDDDKSQIFDACASLDSLQILAAGTLRRVMGTKKGKDTKKASKASMSIRPSSIVSVAASIQPAPYIIPPLEAIPLKTCHSSSERSSGSESKKVNRRSAIRRASCSFDTDPSIYCSAHAQAKYSDGRGEICRITIEVSVDPTPSSSSSFSSAHTATTKLITWPKEFIMPNNHENSQPMYTSVAEHEYARLVNALVALERLDSAPGSKNRFPKELLDLLPRILNFVHEKDILFGPKPSLDSSSNGSSSSSPGRKDNEAGVGRDKLPPVKIANLADTAAVYNPPGLFEGIEAVFTHGQLAAQGSLVTNRQRRGIVSVTNFQKSGFFPPYEEDMKGLFVEKVSCSFWNVPSGGGGEDEREGERCGGRQDEETKDRKRKTTSNIWPFKRCIKLSTANTSTTTFPAALPLESFAEVDEDGDCNDVRQEDATFAMPAGSISVHGKHPVPYPLLNHAIENGLTCRNRYMVLVEASTPMLSSPTSASLAFSHSTDSLGSDSASAQGLNGPKRSSVASTIPTAFSAAAPLVAGTSGDSAILEKSGSFSRMTSQLKAKLKFKTKKHKNKIAHEDDDEQDPGCLTIEELIEHPTGFDNAFSMTPIVGATTTTANAPGLECFLPISSPSTSAPSLLTPPPPPRMPFVIQLPTFHKSLSSLSLSLSLPKSATSAYTAATQGALLPEDPKVCRRGWAHFMTTMFAFETNAIKASSEAAAAAAETSSRVNLGLGLGDRARTNGDDGGGSNNNSNSNRYNIQEVWPTQKTSFPTIKSKDSTYFHIRQQRSLTDATFGRSDSIQALESLVCISKTLQNTVVVQEIGGTILTPEIFLGAISGRQQEWQRGEDARLEEIEMEKEKLRVARVEAAERQERDQEERRVALKLLREQLEEQLGGHQKGKKQVQAQTELLKKKQEKQQQEGLQKGKQRWFQDDEIQEVPPEVPLKDCFSTVHPKDGEFSSGGEADTGAGVESAQDAFSQSKPCRSGSKLKTPSFFIQVTSAILDTTTTATTTTTTTTTLKDPRFLNPFKSAPQSYSLATSSSALQSYSVSTAPAHRHHGRTPAYLIRSPDDDILYSAPGLQRDPIPSELPDHILFPSTTTGTRSSPFDSSMVHESDLPHRLGTMIAPALPSYGVRLTNISGTKTLAQEESERIEREKCTFWKELEALCEPPEDRRVNLCTPPGIALLSIAELERHVEVVERYVEEMRDWRARFLFHQK